MGPDDELLAEAAECLRRARKLVVFTGAGISVESGIDTFRDDAGLWQRFPPEQFANWPGLLSAAVWQPRRLAEFLHAVLGPVADAQPNAAHVAIAQAEKHVNVTVITQNVDRLHQEAGSTTVREIHGSLFEVVTVRGRFVRLLSRADMRRIAARLEGCTRGWFALPRLALAVRPLVGLSIHGLVRPRAVLFNEWLAEPEWTDSERDAAACEVMLVVGTSGVVLPAAMLPYTARDHGATVIAVDPTDGGIADLWLRGNAAEIVPKLFATAFAPDEHFGE